VNGVDQDRRQPATGSVTGLRARQDEQRGERHGHPRRATGRSQISDHRHQEEAKQGERGRFPDPGDPGQVGRWRR
jgi:hypothetical protein